MSTCGYCVEEIAWLPTTEGVRPFELYAPLPSTTKVAVLRAHDCPMRKRAMKSAQTQFMQAIANDPLIHSYAMTLECPKCGRGPSEPCRDLRTKVERDNRNPHDARMIEGAERAQQAEDGAG